MGEGCVQCPEKQYSDKHSEAVECEWCTHCKRNEIQTRNCTQTSNTECKCPTGYIYDLHKPCAKCPKGMFVEKNQCKQQTTSRPTDTKTDYTLEITIGICFSILLLIIIGLIVLIIHIHRRRNRNRRNTPPDILQPCMAQQTTVLTATPPLPEKTKHYHHPASDNYYGPPPMVTPAPLRVTPLRLKDLKFSLVHDMEHQLSLHYQRNYKDLAGQLNYDAIFVRALEDHANPVEQLLTDYVTRQDSTKEQLYEALLAIRRKDVAEWFWADCQPIRQDRQQDIVRQQDGNTNNTREGHHPYHSRLV